MRGELMLEIKNISKEFEKNVENNKKIKFLADKNISFNVNDGEILGLLGPNGAGKTTLLRIIAGIMKPTDGEIIFNNEKLDENEIKIKKNISFLSGNTKLYRDINSAINIGIKAKVLSSSDYKGIDLTKPLYTANYNLHKQRVSGWN